MRSKQEHSTSGTYIDFDSYTCKVCGYRCNFPKKKFSGKYKRWYCPNCNKWKWMKKVGSVVTFS